MRHSIASQLCSLHGGKKDKARIFFTIIDPETKKKKRAKLFCWSTKFWTEKAISAPGGTSKYLQTILMSAEKAALYVGE
jgi:hypothetical protein